MVNMYHVPSWFTGYDSLFELSFAVIALLVGYYSYQIYNVSKQRQPRLFAIAFFLISSSYFIQSLLNLIILLGWNQSIHELSDVVSIGVINSVGIYTHIILFLSGTLALTYVTFKIDDIRIFLLLCIIALSATLYASNSLIVFYLLSSILLFFVFLDYLRNKDADVLIIIAFGFLALGDIHFIFSLSHDFFYVLGHVLDFVAYIMILINLVLVIKRSSLFAIEK